ncbi:MAG: hypothetical protein R3D69_13840 [Xanthobacteraceae bacterium]
MMLGEQQAVLPAEVGRERLQLSAQQVLLEHANPHRDRRGANERKPRGANAT